ncbi:unnamed protein product, partial [Rotaria magnacalcarata]
RLKFSSLDNYSAALGSIHVAAFLNHNHS